LASAGARDTDNVRTKPRVPFVLDQPEAPLAGARIEKQQADIDPFVAHQVGGYSAPRSTGNGVPCRWPPARAVQHFSSWMASEDSYHSGAISRTISSSYLRKRGRRRAVMPVLSATPNRKKRPPLKGPFTKFRRPPYAGR
jgi:hypothetical protein